MMIYNDAKHIGKSGISLTIDPVRLFVYNHSISENYSAKSH